MPPDEPHIEFLALCALAISGSLMPEERKSLAGHVSWCNACRRAMAQYEAVAGKVLPSMAADSPDRDIADNSFSWSIDQAEASLFARIEQTEDEEREPRKSFPKTPVVRSDTRIKLVNGDTLWRHMWWQYTAGLALLASLGFSLYHIGKRRGDEVAQQAVPLMPSAGNAVQNTTNRIVASSPIPATDSEDSGQIAGLRFRIESQSAEIARLKASEKQIERDRTIKAADFDRLSQERSQLAQQLDTLQASVQGLEQKLNAATNQSMASAIETATLEAKISQLSDALHERDQEVARAQDLLDHDRDIRELMGERNLYIAEVYDVAKTGDTEKPFGRVFYTRGKSLIFYAYDLVQQRGIKDADTFQAWGRRGPDTGRAVNLGILFQDNASKKRWVLKSRDPKTLGEIDAVFVTVEPNGGSMHPSGKPLLFAYLHNDPNHP